VRAIHFGLIGSCRNFIGKAHNCWINANCPTGSIDPIRRRQDQAAYVGTLRLTRTGDLQQGGWKTPNSSAVPQNSLLVRIVWAFPMHNVALGRMTMVSSQLRRSKFVLAIATGATGAGASCGRWWRSFRKSPPSRFSFLVSWGIVLLLVWLWSQLSGRSRNCWSAAFPRGARLFPREVLASEDSVVELEILEIKLGPPSSCWLSAFENQGHARHGSRTPSSPT